ncbi:MAG: type II secretion system protein [Nitrospirota bacterium]|nr:type II secretion system protein [Nitrospirota bacterium]
MDKKSKRLPASRLDDANGFTLIEVGLVVFLIALLAGILVPRMDSVFGFQGQRNIRILRALLEQASQDAILRPSPLYVHLDLDSGEVWVDGVPTASNERLSIQPYATLRLGKDVRIIEVRKRGGKPIAKGTLTLAFSKDSIPERFVCVAQDNTGRIQTLWMNALTGLVSIEPGQIPEKLFEQYEDQPFYPGI